MDDGAKDIATSLAMARMAVEDGIGTILVTPHQLGSYATNRGDIVRRRTAELTVMLARHAIRLTVLPGGDVRIEEDLVQRIAAGDVLTLGDHGRHVLLELPHELYVPLEPNLDRLAAAGVVGILSHPERNVGILHQPTLLGPLVDRGCLMQVTAGSLTGSFGGASRRLAEWMLSEGLVHFLATDAHALQARRPRLRPAFERAAACVDMETAIDLCCRNPVAIAAGHDIAAGRRDKRGTGVSGAKQRRPTVDWPGRSGKKNRSPAVRGGWWPWSKAS